MPALLGETVEAARAAIAARGLDPSVSYRDTERSAPDRVTGLRSRIDAALVVPSRPAVTPIAPRVGPAT